MNLPQNVQDLYNTLDLVTATFRDAKAAVADAVAAGEDPTKFNLARSQARTDYNAAILALTAALNAILEP